ncbi:MAG: hypothetical protein HYU36_03435 [Planctomycetes bacterium]|nr:hypothetical protein [Planctomycetota bacterium]
MKTYRPSMFARGFFLAIRGGNAWTHLLPGILTPLCLAAGCQTAAGPFLGVPEDQDVRIEDRQSALFGTVTLTRVQLRDYQTYLALKRDELISEEETRDGYVYYAVDEIRHLPTGSLKSGSPGGAFVTVRERYRARIPDGDGSAPTGGAGASPAEGQGITGRGLDSNDE